MFQSIGATGRGPSLETALVSGAWNVRRTMTGSTAIALAMIAAPAFAQDAVPSGTPQTAAPAQSGATVEAPPAASDGETLGDIVVTANRRQQRLQDVGIAVATFDGGSLKEMGLTKSSDLAQLTPGVSVTGSVGGQSQQFTVRGVTQASFSDFLESPVAVYIDDVYIPSQQGQSLALFDIDRVEILKGPQGTLFGRNATGGLVNTLTATPSFERPSGYGELTYGRFNEVKAEGALNLPLASNAAIRVSGFYDKIGNTWKNAFPAGVATGAPTSFGGLPSPCCQGEGNGRTFAGRAQLKWEPITDLTVRLTASGVDQKMSTGPYTSSAVIGTYDSSGRLVQVDRVSPTETRIAIGPGGANYANYAVIPFAQFAFPYNGTRVPGATWFGYTPLDPKSLTLSSDFAADDVNTVTAFIGAAHVDYKLGNVNVSSITAWQTHKKNLLIDADGSPINLFNFGANAKTNAFSQELRFSGGDGAFRWTGGFYYLNTRTGAISSLMGAKGSAFATAFGAGATGIEFSPLSHFKSRSISGFGQVEIGFAPKWNFILGGRIIREHQEINSTFNAYVNANDYVIDTATVAFPYASPYSDKRNKTLWAGKAQIEFRPIDKLLLYAGVNRGVKGGNYNSPGLGTPLTASQIPFNSEVLTNYEGGFKYGDRRFAFNASGFYYDYKNYQAYLFANASGYITNVPMKVYGIDADIGGEVFTGLRVSLGASYSHAQIDNFQIAPGVFRNVRPPYAPRAQITGLVRYEIPDEVAGGKVSFNASANYASGFYHNLRNFNADWFAGRTLVNLSATWTQDPTGFRLTAFVNNVFDKRYGLIGFDNAPNCGCNDESFGPPITWGVTAGFRF